MAARTEERRALAKTLGAKDPWEISWERVVREEWELQARMTLGEAMRLLRGPSWACACTGFPDCCVYRGAQARALQRGAHIVAKLVADTAGEST
jgi:hypothetical protein